MGMVYAVIELINCDDMALARKHIIGEEEIKRIQVRMLVDTGAYMLCINENIQEYLQLPFREKKRCELADGRIVECDIVGPVDLKFANRRTGCYAYVLPGDSEPLLGSIPLEEMDVIIDAQRQELMINPLHPEPQMRI